MRKFTMTFWLLAVACSTSAAHGQWIDLFDGKSLEGWEVHSGTATYVVEDGTILGTAVLGSPNSFLCTKEQYGDFILEFDVKVDPDLNSGVQFRSLIADKEMTVSGTRPDGSKFEHKIPADRVYGYQVEIANEASAQSGNVYDEARRGVFLDDFSNRPDAGTAFKDNLWNRYLIVCKGKSIRTWINGVPCAEFHDDVTARGVIGLQVHGVGTDNFKPYQVRWRNIRLLKLD